MGDAIAPSLPMSKSFIKLTNLPYFWPDRSPYTADDFKEVIESSLYHDIINHPVSKPWFHWVSLHSNSAILFFDLWESQTAMKAKLLTNYTLLFENYVCTFWGVTMHTASPLCNRYWRWGYPTHLCKACNPRCSLCGDSHHTEQQRTLVSMSVTKFDPARNTNSRWVSSQLMSLSSSPPPTTLFYTWF